MGDLRFSVPDIEDFDPRVWETAYITGIEGIPWLCRHSQDGSQFSIGREIDESGKLNIVWPTSCMGNICLSTTSLRISDNAYMLAAEIARGTVHRLKAQTSEWQRIGLRLPDTFFPLAESSLSELLHALTSKSGTDTQLARSQKAIELALKANLELCDAYSLQALEARRNNEGRLSTLLGAQLPSAWPNEPVATAIETAFNLAAIPADLGSVETASGRQNFDVFDQQIEWALKTERKVCVGPIVDFRSLPQWMVLLNEGFDSVLDAACAFTKKTVDRYQGRTHLWNCAAGLNIPGQMGWTDEEVLRMAVSLIETVRRNDERCPVLLTIDQPWSEYLRGDANGISPLHFADALIRADLGLSGLALELNFDEWPGGSFPRDPIEVSRLVDRWAMLGLPLMIVMSCPTDMAFAKPTNPNRVSSWQMKESLGHVPADSILRLLISKPSVHAVIWKQLIDEEKVDGGTGLWTSRGKRKPVLTSITKLRQRYLH